jgi:hypothetical protein
MYCISIQIAIIEHVTTSRILFLNIAPSHLLREQIHKHYGQFPTMEDDFTLYTNGPGWLWWLISVLPLDPRIQTSLLAMLSLKERLDGVKRVIQYNMEQSSHKISIFLSIPHDKT